MSELSKIGNSVADWDLGQVRRFVVRREVKPKDESKKAYTKAPRIQRLVTPQRLQHKRHLMAVKRRRAEAAKDAAVCHHFIPIAFTFILRYKLVLTLRRFQNEYASILAKRVNEEKAKKTELRSKSIPLGIY